MHSDVRKEKPTGYRNRGLDFSSFLRILSICLLHDEIAENIGHIGQPEENKPLHQ